MYLLSRVQTFMQKNYRNLNEKIIFLSQVKIIFHSEKYIVISIPVNLQLQLSTSMYGKISKRKILWKFVEKEIPALWYQHFPFDETSLLQMPRESRFLLTDPTCKSHRGLMTTKFRALIRRGLIIRG